MIEVTDDKVKIKGKNKEILGDYVSLMVILCEKMCLEEGMEAGLFEELFTSALAIAMDEVLEGKSESYAVEESEYLS